jgi:hypothetical protein
MAANTLALPFLLLILTYIAAVGALYVGVDDDAYYELVAGTDPGKSKAAAAAAAAAGAAAEGVVQPAERFSRIIVNRSMLRDHYLSHYVTGLHKLELQMLEEAAAA